MDGFIDTGKSVPCRHKNNKHKKKEGLCGQRLVQWTTTEIQTAIINYMSSGRVLVQKQMEDRQREKGCGV